MRRWNWKRMAAVCSAGALACGCLISDSVKAADLKEAAPVDSFIVVYNKHNPERDYQKVYYEEIWKTMQQTRLLDRSLQIIQSRIGEADAEQFVAVREAITNALAPVEWDKLGSPSELLFAQRMVAPGSQQLVMIRLPEGGAASLRQGLVNLFELGSGASKGKLTTTTESVVGMDLTILNLPAGVPLQPCVGATDDLFLFATSREFAASGLELLNNPEAESKFDDVRFKEAISHLPQAEDSLVFFDGRTMMTQMKGFAGFIRQVSNGDPNAARVASLMESAMNQFDAFDYEVTVEYTDGFQNRSATLGRFQENAGDKVLGKMIAGQQKFEDWSKWVPSSANGFSLSSGANLHPIYEWIMTEVPVAFPEAQPGLDRFAAMQDQFDLHLDEDLLQGFGGEVVSLSFPGPQTAFGKSSSGVLFARCTKPERIQELIHRGFNAISEIPQVKAQGIGLREVAGMEGFEEITANFLGMVGVRPVIGFHDGWMVVASSPDAVRTALETQAGESESFATTDQFSQFGLTVEGPVSGISYKNTGESIRQMSQGLQQAGMMLPMFIGMAGGQGKGGPDLSVVQEIAGLLPAVGQIIGKFDFIDQQMSVTQTGPADGTYLRESVTLIRPPAPVKPERAIQIESTPAPN